MFNLIKKNFLVIFRNRSSVLMLFLVPILIIFLLGMAFNHSNTYNINIGIYSTKYTALTNDLIQTLGEKNFNIHQLDTEEECIEEIKIGTTNICVVFPPDLEIKEGKTNNIIFHVDPSRINLVWMILDTISQKLSSKSEEISLELTSELISRIQSTNEELTEKKDVLQAIKNGNEDILDSIKDMEGSIELAIDVSTYDTKEIKDANDKLKKNVDADIKSLESVADDIKANLDSIMEEANSTGNAEIAKDAEDIDHDLEDLRDKLDSISNEVTSDSETIGEEINNIYDGFVDMNRKLIALKKLIPGLKSDLEDQNDRIDDLENSFDNIINNINSIAVGKAENIVNPITTTIKPVVAEKTHLNYVFSGIIMLIIMFVSILLASTIVLMEKKSKSYLINYMTPTRDITFVMATYITIILLMIVQIAIMLGIASYFFGDQLWMNLHTISLVLFVAATLFVLLGMLIAYFFKAEQTITLVTIGVGLLFTLLSDLILPLESMPRYFQAIVMFNPFLIAENVLKRTLLFGSNVTGIWQDLLYLLIYIAVLFFLILLVENMIKRHTLKRIFRKIFPAKKL